MSRLIALGLVLALTPVVLAAPAPEAAPKPDELPPGALYRLGAPRMRHGTMAAICCAFSPDGKVFATVGNDKLGKLWDVGTGKLLFELKGHNAGVQGVAFTPDGKQVLTGGMDNALRLWDVATGKEVRVFTGHTAVILPVAISPDGKLAASEAHDETIRIWDLATGKETMTLPGHTSQGTTNIAFSPDGKLLASCGADFTLHLWDLATGKDDRQFMGHQGDVNSLEFSPDGKHLLSASIDKTVRIWDVALAKEILLFDKHTHQVSTARFTPDGKSVLSGSVDRTLRLWDRKTGEEKRLFLGHRKTVSEVVVTPDGKTVGTVGHDGTVRLWDMATGRELPQSGGVADWAVLSPDGREIATGGGGWVRFWDAATGKPIKRELEQNSAIVRLDYGDGKTLVTLGDDDAVRIFDLTTGKKVKEMAWPKDPARLPLSLHSLAVSNDGKKIVTGGIDTARTWDATGKELQLPFASDDSRREGPMRSLVMSADGKLVATLQNDPNQRFAVVHLWDGPSGQELRTIRAQAGMFGKLSLTPDGRSLAVCAPQMTLRLWETATGLERVALPQPVVGPTGGAVAVSRDSFLVAVANADKTLTVYDTVFGQEVVKFAGHAEATYSLAFLPGNRGLMSVADDATVIVWDLKEPLDKLKRIQPKLDTQALNSCWDLLAEKDGIKAFQAIWALVWSAEQAVPMLRERLTKTMANHDLTRIPGWIRDLDSDEFSVREKATKELDRLGQLAEKALQEVLQKPPSLEVKLRATALLAKLKRGGGSPEDVRARRAVEVLERINDAEARKLLEKLADGPAEGVLTSEAKAALARLAPTP